MKNILFKWSVLYNYLKYKYFLTFSYRKQLQEYQQKRLREHLRFITRKSAFYAAYKDKELIDFPIVNKAIMMDHFDRMNTVGIEKEKAFDIALHAESSRDFNPKYGNITVGLSSGTSGNRGLFAVSDHERAQWVGAMFAKILPNGILAKYRVAFFLRADSNLYQSVRSNRVKFCFFDLLEDINVHIPRLNEFKPDILVAPASMLRLLADRKKWLAISPSKIISVAEVLDDFDKIAIERAFGMKCDEIYQATEGFLAYRMGSAFIVNEDVLFVEKEYIGKNRFVPIITDFTRKSQPVIRYRLNDVWLETEDNSGPFLKLDKVLGREDDLLVFKNKCGELKYIFPDFISRMIISISDRIEEYRVIVEKDTKFVVELKINTPGDISSIQEKIKAGIKRLLSQSGIDPLPVEFCEYIPQKAGEKKRRIIFR